MFEEFKKFAVKGNVVDMSVGIIIGAAFTAIVKSAVDDLLMPVLGLVTGPVDFSNKFFLLKAGDPPAPYATLDAAKEAGAVAFAYGRFVNATISFLLVSIVLFFVVRWMNRLRSPETPPAPGTKPCPFCKSNVDMAATRCAFCTSQLDEA